jgi:hypothetical protein
MRPRAPSPCLKTGTVGGGPADTATVVIGLDGSSLVRRFLVGPQVNPAAGRPDRLRLQFPFPAVSGVAAGGQPARTAECSARIAEQPQLPGLKGAPAESH